MVRLGLIAALLGSIWIGNNWIQVTRYRILPGFEGDGSKGTEVAQGAASVPPAAGGPGLRILQISDLHGKRFGRGAWRLLRRVDGLDYDIVVISGDVVTGGIFPRGLDAALTLCAELAARAPVYYVTGNHEATSPQFERLEQGLHRLGVHVLRGDLTVVDVRGRRYTLLGLDDYRFFVEEQSEGLRPRPRRAGTEAAKTAYAAALRALVVKASDSEHAAGDLRPRILLSHRPDMLDVYADAGVDLVLTGHVHGGQFRIPGVGGILAPDQGFFPRYDAGVFRRRGTTMVISRGLGPSIIPVRLFNRPELVLVDVAAR